MMKRILTVLLTLCMLTGFCGGITQPAAQAESKKGYVVSATLKVYKKASKSSKVLGVMAYGEKISVLATSGKWARIKNSSGSIGYCAKSGLSAKNPNTLNKKLYAKQDGVKVYKKPGTSSGVITKLKKNACCRAVALTPNGKWFRLKNGDKYGYVQASKMSKQKVSQSGKTASKASKVVSLAKDQKNKPYSYASKGPKYFDCSGLAYYVYKKAAGITLKRTAELQAKDGRFSKIGSTASLKAGDLICFDIEDSGSCDHVAICIGSGKFVHASSSAGKVVVSAFDSYYRNRFMFGRRIV